MDWFLRWLRSQLDCYPQLPHQECNSKNTFFLLSPHFQARTSMDPMLLGNLKEPSVFGLSISLNLLGPPTLVRAISLGICSSKQCLWGIFQNRYYNYQNPSSIAQYLTHLILKSLDSFQFHLSNWFKFKVPRFKL